MANRECARYMALSALIPFAESRIEDMAESDSKCVLFMRARAAMVLGVVALNDGTTPRELATARKSFESLDIYVVHHDGLGETCGPRCPCKIDHKE